MGMKKLKPVKPEELKPDHPNYHDPDYQCIMQPPPLTDAFGFPVTKRTRKRAAQEGYDVVVIRGIAYYVYVQEHQFFAE